MAHKAQSNFFTSVLIKYPEKFTGCRVLDIGSLDINGNNRYLFNNYTYVGIDVGPGDNVDVVCKGHEYTSDTLFDIVISSECFEHDMFYEKTILNAIRLTKDNGIFLFSCASTGRKEHGTEKTGTQSESPHTSTFDGWKNYYKNLTENDIRGIIDPDTLFSDYKFQYNPFSFDLYFYGIKSECVK